MRATEALRIPLLSRATLFAFVCSLLLALGLLPLNAIAQTNGASTRVAILVQSAEAAQAADLLSVQLSSRKDVQLLERSEIDRIYREQQLPAGNREYLRLGQVLGADGLIVLEVFKAGTNTSLVLRFIAVKPGVLLTSERFPWSASTAPDWAAGINRHLAPLIPKAAVLAKDAVPISIVSLRSALQSPEGRDLEQQLTVLLNERLSRQREVFMLERRNIQAVSSEKELHGIDDSPFWSGSFLLDGTIDPNGYSQGVLTIRARLVPPRGGVPQVLEISGSRTNATDAVERLATQVLAALKLQPSIAAWNPAEEANQFFADAAWAYRWGLLAQAQAAGESAWALGLRTEPLAALRLKAYADAAVPVWTQGGNIYVPGLPDPAKLKPLRRALELFNQDCRLAFTNESRLNAQWYLEGLHLFRWAAATLDGFYRWAELAETHQAQLADVRALAREMVALLDSKAPMDRAQIRQGLLHVTGASMAMSMELDQYELAKWNEGGLLFERPEDSLPFYRSMLEQAYAAPNLPRVTGWHWDQRKTAPKVLRQFLDDLCASTNPVTRLAGLNLKLANTPFYPETTFHERENEVVAALWDCRDWLISAADHAQVLAQTESILRNAYSDSDANKFFSHEPFAGVRFRLEREFLARSTNFDNVRFEAVFPRTYLDMPPEQAKELAAAMEHLAHTDDWRGKWVATIRDRLRQHAGLPALATNTAPAAPVVPGQELLTAQFVRWHLRPEAPAPGQHAHCQRLIARNGRLWTMAGFLDQYQEFGLHGPRLCLSIDPATGNCEEIPVPEKLGEPDTRFEVTKDSLYVSFADHLGRYRFTSHAWERMAVPMETGAGILALGDKLYLWTGNSVLELDPSSLALQILGSARRQPPVNDLDPLCSSGVYLYGRANANLGIFGRDKFLEYQPVAQTWIKGPVLSATAANAAKVPFFGPAGVIVVTESFFKWQALAFWDNAPAGELLLEKFRDEPGTVRPPRGEYAPGNPRWEWPAGFDLNTSRLLVQDKSVWVLAPRKIWHFMGIESHESAQFSDARQATLLYYTTDSHTPLALAIGFEDSGIEPFNPRQGGYAMGGAQPRRKAEVPFWLDTPAGLVFSAPAVGGHWLIPRAPLEARIAALRNKTSAEHSPGAQSPLPASKL